MSIDPALLEGVDVLCLDAGNTVIFLDHARLAALLEPFGARGGTEAFIRFEGEAKRLQQSDALVDVAWSSDAAPGARGWGRMVGTMAHLAGVPKERLPAAIEALWRSHLELNLWSLVPAGLGEALDAVRAAGVRTVIVSNSEGMLDGLFVQLKIRSHFDAIIDSGLAGVEKPDPRIFELALAPFSAKASQALHLGDSYATDVLGARAAGIRTALIDPFDHWAGLHADVPRVAGVVAVASALTARAATTP
jgi:HAD superfamily hydrolase (TIGR01509 family)